MSETWIYTNIFGVSMDEIVANPNINGQFGCAQHSNREYAKEKEEGSEVHDKDLI